MESCVNYSATTRLRSEKYMAENIKLYATFMDLQNTYDCVDWKEMLEVVKVYVVGGDLSSEVKTSYCGAITTVKEEGHFEGKK